MYIWLGVQAHLYSGHSFRSGIATTAASQGFENTHTRMLGKQYTVALNGYIAKALPVKP